MKGQISIEFLIGVGIILIIYTISIWVYSSYTQNRMVENEEARQVCYIVSTSIDASLIGGNGFGLNLSLPEKINRKDYLIFINEDGVTINLKEKIFSCSTITQNITEISFPPAKVSFNNLNGTVYVTAIITNKTEYKLGESIEIYGKYFLGNVTLIIKEEDLLPGFPIEIKTENSTFNYVWSPTSTGKFEIIAFDKMRKTFYSKKEIYII